MTSEPICLSFPNWNEEIVLISDSSRLGCGYIIANEDRKGVQHVIAYGGRQWTKHVVCKRVRISWYTLRIRVKFAVFYRQEI